uniref:Uncharacterized protein MANES_03G020200 n=1 Tax=Rhizophora mucronata TaxID=61149 RepID=A0A2P2J564_RHIMU
MASMALSICPSAKPLLVPPTSTASASSSSSSACYVCRCSPILTPVFRSGCFVATICQKNYSRRRRQLFVVCMAPDEEQLTRRNPLDFPIVRPCFFSVYIYMLCN